MRPQGQRSKPRTRAISACALLAALVACSRISYTLVVTTSGTGSGSFTTTGGSLTCTNDPTAHLTCKITHVPERDQAPAPTLTIKAVPSADSIFLGWTGICTGTGPCAATVDQDKKLSAEFVKVDYGTLTKTDTAGNSIVTGTFYLPKTLGSTTLTRVGEVDVYVAKFPAGTSTPAWAVSLGGQGLDFPQDLQLDPNGDVLLQITHRSPITLSGTTYACADPHQTLIIKLAGADGTVIWSRCLTP